MSPTNKPPWYPNAPAASLRKWAEYLHGQAKASFLKDKTQTHILFYFTTAKGMIAVAPVPGGIPLEEVNATVKKAIQQRHLYAVISLSEAWVYLHKPGHDHTAFQIRHGEMDVSELRDEDKSLHLYVRMESQDGDCVVIMDEIARAGGRVEMGESTTLEGEERRWFAPA